MTRIDLNFKKIVNRTLSKFTNRVLIHHQKLDELITKVKELQTDLHDQEALLKNSQQNLSRINNFYDNVNFELYYAKKRNEILESICNQSVNNEFKLFCAANIRYSHSQLLQDLIAIFLLGPQGFFCEVGGAGGKQLSNTFLLEDKFDWKGIVVEPAICFRDELSTNRNCQLSFKCVFGESGKLMTFLETADPYLSTLVSFVSKDMHAEIRKVGSKASYEVETISLEDLLIEYSAPNYIDYLSIDTEGSEFEILNNFDFNKYSFGFISVEHNFTDSREKLFELLTSKGYLRVLPDVSEWDDYYVSQSLWNKIFLI